MKKLIYPFFYILFVTNAYAENKIVYIDVQYILNNSEI